MSKYPTFDECGKQCETYAVARLYWQAIAMLSTSERFRGNVPQEVHDAVVDQAKAVYREDGDAVAQCQAEGNPYKAAIEERDKLLLHLRSGVDDYWASTPFGAKVMRRVAEVLGEEAGDE